MREGESPVSDVDSDNVRHWKPETESNSKRALYLGEHRVKDNTPSLDHQIRCFPGIRLANIRTHSMSLAGVDYGTRVLIATQKIMI